MNSLVGGHQFALQHFELLLVPLVVDISATSSHPSTEARLLFSLRKFILVWLWENHNRNTFFQVLREFCDSIESYPNVSSLGRTKNRIVIIPMCRSTWIVASRNYGETYNFSVKLHVQLKMQVQSSITPYFNRNKCIKFKLGKFTHNVPSVTECLCLVCLSLLCSNIYESRN